MVSLVGFATVWAFLIHHRGGAFPDATTTSRWQALSSSTNEFSEFCLLNKVTPTHLLTLQTVDGVRGVYMLEDVAAKDVLLRVPLSSCLRDDAPPHWLSQEEDDDARHPQWPTRLAASLLDAQLSQQQQYEPWLSLLPDASELRASLPVHWPEPILETAHSRALELAVDAVYFSRAEAVAQLVQGLRERKDYAPQDDDDEEEELTKLCHNALDVVQTRCCCCVVAQTDKTTLGDDTSSTPLSEPLRILAPVYDMINHVSDTNNAYFGREGDDLVVRAVRDIGKGTQVFIDYGASARTPWKCLASYGFVPSTIEATAEVTVDGVRTEIGPGSVPVELIEAAAAALGVVTDEENPLPVAVASRISEQAQQLVTELAVLPDIKVDSEEDQMSLRLALDLRQSQRKVLENWSKGLADYAAMFANG